MVATGAELRTKPTRTTFALDDAAQAPRRGAAATTTLATPSTARRLVVVMQPALRGDPASVTASLAHCRACPTRPAGACLPRPAMRKDVRVNITPARFVARTAMLRRFFLAAALTPLLSSLFVVAPALAQDGWPAPGRPIQLIVPAPGGSGTGDTIARILAEEMATRLKTNFVIDNKAGANGNIGATAAAQAPGDGYHFLFSWAGTLAVNKALYRNLPFDAQKDFIPIGLVADVPNILVVNN